MTRFAAALFVVSLAGWATWLVLLRPTYQELLPASGAIGALADAVLRGQAPGAEDGRTFLGTYYLPPVPAAVALARRAGFSWRDALRVVSALSALLLAAAVWQAATVMGGGRAGALLAVTLLLAAYPIRASSAGGRADLLATACAIAAVAAWMKDPELRGWRAPVLAAAAWLVKALAVAVPVAVVIWALARRRPGIAGRFAVRFVVAAGVGVALTIPLHGPAWYAQVWRDLFLATPGSWNPLRAPVELLRYAGGLAELTVIGALGILTLLERERRSGPAAAYGGVALALALFAFANYGAAHNHLIELTAFGAAAAGAWVARSGPASPVLPGLLALALAGATARDLGPVLRYAGMSERRARLSERLRSEPGAVLTEDALPMLVSGRRPELSDPSALRTMSLNGDARAARVEQAIRQRRFALVVLDHDLDESAYWYSAYHLGDPIVRALRDAYRKEGILDEHHLYRPRPVAPTPEVGSAAPARR